ncbi:MAG: branched-chain amino acid ABC transporter permease [Candidatus ainarchaeum sp.]|nr:branched-chain amino acid ABC transporter permease [Candidatus ainarchaeum sp.]
MFNYLFTVLVFFIYNLLTAVAANLTIGYLGLFNLGLIAFVGIGAYSYALVTKAGLGFWPAALVAIVLPGLFAIALQLITKKLKGDYFGIATLGFTYVVFAILINSEFSNGAFGIAGIAKPEIFGYVFRTPGEFLFFSTIVLVIVMLIVWKLVNSRFGKLMEAIRDDEVSVKVLGKNTNAVKYKVLFFAGAICGLAGLIFASFITFIDPYSFLLQPLIVILTIAILGGLASFWGPVLGAAIITSVPEILRFVGLPSSILGPARILIYAIILILVLIYWPKGLMGRIKYD